MKIRTRWKFHIFIYGESKVEWDENGWAEKPSRRPITITRFFSILRKGEPKVYP